MCLAASVFAKEFNSSKFVHVFVTVEMLQLLFLRRYPDALSDHVLLDQELASRKNSEIGSFRLHSKWVIPWWVESGEKMRLSMQASTADACGCGAFCWNMPWNLE